MGHEDRSHGWQLDDTGAAAYERNLVPVFLDAWAADLVDAVGVKPAERILDVACGTGIVARHAARRVGPDGQVTGVDATAAMLSEAREAASRLDLEIRWKQASADDLPLPDESFDAVLCQQGLQFFPDRPAALAEMYRVTRPDGRLGVSTCRPVEHQPAYALLIDILMRHVGVQAGKVIASPYALGDPDELRRLITNTGFHDVHLRIAVWSIRFSSAEALLRAETASSPLGDLVDQLDRDVQEALIDDLAHALLPHTDDDGIIFPFETNVVIATR
ncbi:MAG: methyltransferase domain-containing protein [Actinomycetota bacterium]|nr:methyltransferase domain-containing protein [Actinomycetota bacterium]